MAPPITRRFYPVTSRLLKTTEMPIGLSAVEGCAQSPRMNSCSCVVFVLVRISRSRSMRASEIFLRACKVNFQLPR